MPSFFKNWLTRRRFKSLISRLDKLVSDPQRLLDDVLDAQEAVHDEQVEAHLLNTSAEVLKKYKTGARLQPVSKYSVSALRQKSVNRIAQLDGVGPKSAATIKRCAEAYAKEIDDDLRLRISTENPSKNSISLIKNLYQYDLLTDISIQSENLRETALANPEILKKSKAAVNPIRWVFSRDKAGADQSITEMQQILSSPLVTELKSLEKNRVKVLKVKHDTYWKAFQKDPARFYSILENCESHGVRGAKTTRNITYVEILDPALRDQIEHVQLNSAGLRCVLRPYQIFGVKYILHQQNVLLGDEMGLGKTIEAIATLVSLRNSGATHFVVVCPASVLINWEREISKHSDLHCYYLHGSAFNTNYRKWVTNGGVAIINFENTSRFQYADDIAMTVVDEAHYIKNYNAARSQNTIRILNSSERRLLMSGTPLENKLDEMVSLINLLQPKIVRMIYSLSQPIDKDQFRHTIAPVYFRRTKDAVWKEMPDLQVVEEVVALTPQERQLYINCVSQRTMSAFTTMRQISFSIPDSEESSKLRRINEICQEAFENDRKVIIFSFYLNTIKRIKETLGSNVYGPITGSLSPQKRQDIIDEFSNHTGGAALLSQIQAGGTGLNIQKASIVIMCEPQYKPSIENQAIARAYRIGQTSNVIVYRLIGEHTVDERILQILKEKQSLFDTYVDKSESGERSIQLTEEEIAQFEFSNASADL